ncbi:MAG: (2Fe-2S)-binding protein [Acidobacteria bacterium]|nr:(2Fe-2S)-binding protein [Acidobacteriota bacterium]
MTRKKIILSVNGVRNEIEVEAKETLLETLRNRLDLTGAKLGCDQQVCGSCTVLMNDLPVSSCSVLAMDADGCEILTVEGLGAGGALHPIQQAFIEHGAFQCAYCTPGLILAVKYLLSRFPRPTEPQLRHYLAGNICRCGCHVEILQAVRSLARRAQENQL